MIEALKTDLKPLKIVDASAGSGKTYRLVKEYLRLLLNESEDVKRFARIIAMTFTNKAAIEMKIRIVRALDELSHPHLYGEKSLKFGKELSDELKVKPEQIHERSKLILKSILHSYEDFYVMTIDKFNLKLIRSFSRDLDLPNDFDVILEEKLLIEQVVDTIMNKIGATGLTNLTETVFKYAQNNLDEGEKWNFRDKLVEFGTLLNKEKDQDLIEKLMQLDFSTQRFIQLKTAFTQTNELFLSKCKAVFERFIAHNIPTSSLPGGSNLLNKYEALNQLNAYPKDDFFTKTFINNIIEPTPKNKTYPDDLKLASKELVKYYDETKASYFLQKHFLANFYNMALLKFMAMELFDIKKSEQLIRISEFNKLIADLVKNENAPFIYERLGVRYKNFLLDEFQDTSRLQWLNMVPLILESISKLDKNLIVGDPKQSIYRFKNGVAEQFVALPKIYNPENEPSITKNSSYFEEMGEVDFLKENWRSSKSIVAFNNELFPLLKEHLSNEAKDFYKSIHQNVVSKQVGLVNVFSKEIEDEEIDIVTKIIEKIEQCEKDGFKRGDICILGDRNKQTNSWANALSEKGYKVVSADSLLIKHDLKIKLIISYFKLRLNPSNASEQRKFIDIYYRIIKEETFVGMQRFLEEKTTKEGRKYFFLNFDAFVITTFQHLTDFYCKYENLYDLTQSFYSLLNWNELENPYLHHFADFVHDFELKKGPDLKDFLKHFEVLKSKTAIQIPESDDAIKIMTIHKSKGLEFPVVILPDINFTTELKSFKKYLFETDGTILYSTLKEESPIPMISELHKTELNQQFTDVLNLCYVAFTRPESRLYVLNYFTKKGFGKIIHECFKKIPGALITSDKMLSIDLGEASVKEHKKTKESAFFIPENFSDVLWYPEIALQDKKEMTQQDYLSNEQRFGNQFHLAIDQISEASQIEKTLNQLINQGEIERSFKIEMSQKLALLFANKIYLSLFENATEILSEQSILIDSQTTKRPDKIILKEQETIVIDYKTGSAKTNHSQQIIQYISLMNEMNFPSVRGYIYYSTTNELIEINPLAL
jgi:ATP-dependent exoDNAse (exonuclease V) beta subunit/CRISPR/Cas system-associated exonuclease Cas4 (RecB family)